MSEPGRNRRECILTRNSPLRYLRFFSLQKHEIYKKTLKILFFVFYDTSYIQNTGNGNNYLNLPIN